LKIADNAIFHVGSGGLLASFNVGTIQLGNNSTIVIDSSGTLKWDANSTWLFGTNAKVEIYGTVTTATSTTLNFPAGSNVRVYPSARFNIGYAGIVQSYGKFVAIGTAAQRILFTYASTPVGKGKWDRIKLFGGPDTMKYCTIKYANYGVYVNNLSTNIFENCLFDSSLNYGVYAYYTDMNNANGVSIKNSSFKNSSTGLATNNSRVYLESDTLRKNDGSGIQITNAKVYTYKTLVDSNLTYGSYISGSTGKLYLSPEGIANGCNTMKHNTATEVYIATGTAFIGDFPKSSFTTVSQSFNTLTGTPLSRSM
jgi:hypothetical protein